MSLTPSQSMLVAVDCVRFVTGSTRPLNPADQLIRYGVNSASQAAQIRHNICSNGAIGVPRPPLNHSLNPIFLAALNGGWTFAQLATVIRANAQANSPQLVLKSPTLTNAKKLEVAYQKMAEAAQILEELAKSQSSPKVSTSVFKGMTDKKLGTHLSQKKKSAKKGSK